MAQKIIRTQIPRYNNHAQAGQVSTKPLVVDASVAVKWFIPECGSIEAIKLLDGRHQLFAPDIIRPEVGNILWKLYTRRLLTGDEASQIIENFLSLPMEICSSESLLASAFEIASVAGRTVYDSLYLALAVERNAVVVTADQRMVNALKNTYFTGFVRILS
jgi:predicted nucleic acid-binding protein